MRKWGLLLLCALAIFEGHCQFQRPFLDLQANISIAPQSLTLKSVYQRDSSCDNVSLQRLHVATNERPEEYSVNSVVDRVSVPRHEDIQQLRKLSETGRMRWQRLGEPRFDAKWSLLPDVSDHATVLALAMMSNNVYLDKDETTPDWYDLGTPWQVNSSFGWESDGIRGHIFGNADESLLVIGFKGTSAGLFSGGPTGEKDKMNDNMLFSCCCARISRAWRPVCECYKDNSYQCEESCVERSILKEELYYDHAMEIYKDVSDRYPSATIWLTGHSLGGALASMVGQTFGVPTVTFEIPGDRLASIRLHLPRAPGASQMPLWHFGHTADPIFIGVCTGPTSSCWYGGFAMETRCHTGKICVWDTVNDHGWRVDIRSHRVADVIENILKKSSDFPLPQCKPEQSDCQDCGLWDFVDRRDRL